MRVNRICFLARGALYAGLLTTAACASAVNLPNHEAAPVLQPVTENAAYTSQILHAEEPANKTAEPTHHEHNQGELAYVCPMHPEVQSDKPGRCHKCGMQLKQREGARARP